MRRDLPKILVVDDEEMLCDIYETKLRLEGFAVESAYDGCEALQKIVTFGPELVMLDIVMPERAGVVDGYDVLCRMRKDERMKGIKVVIMTNLAMPEDIKRGKELGADEYIVKTDVTPDEAVMVIERVLGIC